MLPFQQLPCMANIYIYTHLYVNSIHTWGLCIEALLAVLFSAQKVLVDGVQRPLGDVLEVRCDFSKASCGWGLMWKKQGAGSGADPWVGGSPQRAPVGDFHAGQGNSSDNKRTHIYIYIYIWAHIYMYVCMYACMHACMHAWMYVCMYVCMYACMHACMHAWMDGWMDVCMYVCMHACMHAWMYVCMYVCMHAWMDVCMYACMHACMHGCMYVCMYACMHACMHGWMYVCMYVCMHACMHACMDGWMYVCMYACMHACMHGCMYGCMYVCMYVFTYMQTAMLENEWSVCSSSSFLRHVKGDLLRLYTYCSPCSGGRFRFCRGRCCHCRHCLSEFSRSRRSPRSKNPTTQVQTAQSLLILLWLFVRLKHSEASGFFCMSSSIGTADFCLVQLLCHCWCRNLGFKDDDVSTFLGAAWRSCRSATTPNGSCKRPGADSRYCRQDVESPGWDWGWLFKSSKFKFPPLENR